VNKVIMYSTQVCPYCQMAERLLKSRGVDSVEKVMIDRRYLSARRMWAVTKTCRRSTAKAV
jgi:glutaredoxin 3